MRRVLGDVSLRGGLALLAFALAVAGCAGDRAPQASHPPPPTATGSHTPPPPTAEPSPSATSSATPDPYTGLTINDLTSRSYGEGDFRQGEILSDTLDVTRTLVDYESDGLRVFGFLDRPRGEGPFPVVLLLHGYVPTEGYQVQTYTARYAASLARAGYVVIHPNYRNYPPSDEGPNLFRVGYAIDVLNLAAMVRRLAGSPGPLQAADGSHIGLFGHSMGGGIALRAITVDVDIQAAVLYGAMSGNERWNYEKIYEWSEGERGGEELTLADSDLARIGAMEYLDRVRARVSIHHGAADPTVPPEWSMDLCARLTELGQAPECFSYPGMPHTFYGDGDARFLQRVIEFFGRTLH